MARRRGPTPRLTGAQVDQIVRVMDTLHWTHPKKIAASAGISPGQLSDCLRRGCRVLRPREQEYLRLIMDWREQNSPRRLAAALGISVRWLYEIYDAERALRMESRLRGSCGIRLRHVVHHRAIHAIQTQDPSPA